MSIQQDNHSPVKTWYNPKDETGKYVHAEKAVPTEDWC